MPAIIMMVSNRKKDFLFLAFIPRSPPFQKGKTKLPLQSMALVRGSFKGKPEPKRSTFQNAKNIPIS
jgi:hypothetical protein